MGGNKYYDGYHFSKNSKDVYAPFSLLNALNDKEANHYWFESGTMTSLIEHLQHYPTTNALEYDGVKVGENEFNISCERAEPPMPLSIKADTSPSTHTTRASKPTPSISPTWK